MDSLPIFKFPTTVVLVDDNQPFLNSLNMVLKQDKVYLSFNNPQKALEFINNSYNPTFFLAKYINFNKPTTNKNQQVSNLHLGKIYEEIYNPERYNQISTIVVDYDMPGMSGLEFCEKVQHPNIRKILLTGMADESTAIEAFNRRLINRFIKKQEINLAKELDTAISKLQDDYFRDLSTHFFNFIPSKEHTAITDDVFVNNFREIEKKHKIIEYYLFEALGSYFLMDPSGTHHNLFTYSQDRMQADYDEIKDEDESIVPKKVKKYLETKEKMLCFNDGADVSIPPLPEWQNHLYNSHILEGRDTYYYTIVKNLMKVDKKNLFTFKDFIKSM